MLPVSPWFAIGLCAVAYLVGRWTYRTLRVMLGFAAMVVVATLLVALSRATFETWLDMVAIVVFAGVLPWLVGRYRQQRQDLARAGWLRAEMLEREQHVVADQVRLRERARIAQEMHDSLGHEMSLIALGAGALELAPDLDERHRAAAAQLRQTAIAATQRLREIIGILGADEDALPMRPHRESVADLVERTRSSGMDVALHRDGDETSVPEVIERIVYYVVREALTNATKHAPGAPATVQVTRRPHDTEVRIVNGAAAAPPRGSTGNGLGLIAAGERVRLVGGTLRAQAHDGGFEVVAQLPHEVDQSARGAVDGPAAARISPSSEVLGLGQRRLRRRFVAVVAVFLCAVVGTVLAYYTCMSFDAELEAANFDRLRIGQSRAEIVGLLPARQVPGRPASEPPILPGSACEYYTDGSFLVRTYVNRLCFVDGHLVSKDALARR